MKKNASTLCVHAGNRPEGAGTLTPIHLSTAYDYREEGEVLYPRYQNTINQIVVAEKVAQLENGEAGAVFSSGMAAISTSLMAFLKAGDHAVFQNDIYGGTHFAITEELEKYGISYDFVQSTDIDAFSEKIKPNTRLIYIETPSNPLLKIVNIKAIVELAKTNDCLTFIDNTFASPINQNPIDLGIDVVMHSGTKYMSGHSDLTCGAVITSSELMVHIKKSAINFGGSLNPMMCSLLERSLKTLALRVRQQTQNAQLLAEFLDKHYAVTKVFYPGLPHHPDHNIAKQQMSGFGAMLSFEPKKTASEVTSKLKLIKPAISLGGVETTVSSPAQSSHAKLGEEGRKLAGISDDLLRVSVGIEDVEDLMEDFENALK